LFIYSCFTRHAPLSP